MFQYVQLIGGLALLLVGAHYLVEGASSLAKRLGISALVIGLTIVAFGTSMPELIVNTLAALQGSSEISFGNIIGSNVANILLILGFCALFYSLKVQRSTVWKEIPFAALAAGVLFVLSSRTLFGGSPQQALELSDGLILLSFFAIFLYYVWELTKNGKQTTGNEGKDEIKSKALPASILMIIGGLVALYFGGRGVVDGAVTIALQAGLSELLISSTIIAVGTSLPELVTSVIAALKKEADISVGNVVGSNIFNIFFIMGATVMIAPVTIPAAITMDLLILVAVSVLLFAVMFIGKKHELTKAEGFLFLSLYGAYVAFLIVRG